MLVPDVMVADLSQSDQASYLGYEVTQALSGGTKSSFGGRSLTDDVIDVTLGILFGDTIPAAWPRTRRWGRTAVIRYRQRELQRGREAHARKLPFRGNAELRVDTVAMGLGCGRGGQVAPLRFACEEMTSDDETICCLDCVYPGNRARRPSTSGRMAFAGDRPDDASAEIVQRAPYHPGSVQKTVEFWEGRTKKAPNRYLEFRELAGAYLARQRETGDIEDAVRAERAARRSLELQDRGNVVALTRLVRSLLGQHRFPEALEAAGRAAALDPKAWLLVADVELELGRGDKARSAFAQAPVDPEDLSAIVLRPLRRRRRRP